MKTTKKMISAAISLLMVISSSGCGQKHELLYDPNARPEETTTAENADDNNIVGTSANSSVSEKSEPPFLTPDSNNPLHESVKMDWGRENAADGGFICFTEPTNGAGAPIVLRNNEYCIHVNDGTVETVVNMIASCHKESSETVTGTIIFFWNGELHDFTVGDKKSENGILKVDMKYFEDIIEPFKAEDLPVTKGTNTFQVYYIPLPTNTRASQRHHAMTRSQMKQEWAENIRVFTTMLCV